VTIPFWFLVVLGNKHISKNNLMKLEETNVSNKYTILEQSIFSFILLGILVHLLEIFRISLFIYIMYFTFLFITLFVVSMLKLIKKVNSNVT